MTEFLSLLLLGGGMYALYVWIPRRKRKRRSARRASRRANKVDRATDALEAGDDARAAWLLLKGVRGDYQRASDATRDCHALQRLAGILDSKGIPHPLTEGIALLERIAGKLNANKRLKGMAKAEQANAKMVLGKRARLLADSSEASALDLTPLLERLEAVLEDARESVEALG